jgi:hypothetical protein
VLVALRSRAEWKTEAGYHARSLMRGMGTHRCQAVPQAG